MKNLSLVLCASIAPLIAACGPNGPNTTGSGGTGDTSTTTGTGGSGNSTAVGGGGNTTTGSGGGGNVCKPGVFDPFITEDPSCDACECPVTSTTDPEFCTYWRSQGVELCPPGGNTCAPGVNKCGYNLPVGQALEAPDAQCQLFVLGDTWTDENFNPGAIGSSPPQYAENGQPIIGGGSILGSPNDYYDGFVMSGRKLYWNRYNQDTADSIVCTFSADCKTLDCVESPSGTIRTYWWQNH